MIAKEVTRVVLQAILALAGINQTVIPFPVDHSQEYVDGAIKEYNDLLRVTGRKPTAEELVERLKKNMAPKE